MNFLNTNIDRTLPKLSISNALDMLFTPFDSEAVAQKTYDKHFDNPQSEYYHMSVNQILEKWSEKGATSCHYGSLMDDYIGHILTGSENDVRLFKLDNGYEYDERLKGLCDSFDNFYSVLSKSGDTEFIDREKYLYLKVRSPLTNEDMYIYGRFDALFKNKRTGKYILIDWKTSGTIDKIPNRWTAKMLGPLFKYPQLNWYRYTLQLYFYKQALIETGYVPEGTNPDDIVVMIVNLPGTIIKETNTNYQIHNGAMPYDANELNTFYRFAITKYAMVKEDKKLDENNSKETEETIEQENLESLF